MPPKEFFFIDSSKLELTDYSYQDFDTITSLFGYQHAKDPDLHNYFDWSKLRHWTFVYEPFSDLQLSELFSKTIVVHEAISFLIRLNYNEPLIQIRSAYLKDMLGDLSHESGMGWEAISICGSYIMEFTDGYEYKAKSNFEILPQ
jgi:hypothetical protein